MVHGADRDRGRRRFVCRIRGVLRVAARTRSSRGSTWQSARHRRGGTRGPASGTGFAAATYAGRRWQRVQPVRQHVFAVFPVVCLSCDLGLQNHGHWIDPVGWRSSRSLNALPASRVPAAGTHGKEKEIWRVTLFVSSVLVPIYGVTSLSLRQTITPDHMQGRVNATNRFLQWGTLPIGSLMGGTLGGAIGLRPTIGLAVLGTILAVVWFALSPVRSLRQPPGALGDRLTISAHSRRVRNADAGNSPRRENRSDPATLRM